MATYSGRFGRVTVDVSSTETLIGHINTWSVNVSAGSTDTSSFGDVWGESDVGILTHNASISGFYDPDDSAQKEFWDKLKDGTLIGSMRIYTKYSATTGQTIKYWKPDTASDPNAGYRVTAYNTGSTAGGVATFDLTVEGSGPIDKIETTVP